MCNTFYSMCKKRMRTENINLCTFMAIKDQTDYVQFKALENIRPG